MYLASVLLSSGFYYIVPNINSLSARYRLGAKQGWLTNSNVVALCSVEAGMTCRYGPKSSAQFPNCGSQNLFKTSWYNAVGNGSLRWAWHTSCPRFTTHFFNSRSANFTLLNPAESLCFIQCMKSGVLASLSPVKRVHSSIARSIWS